jgi:hypothetical protein
MKDKFSLFFLRLEIVTTTLHLHNLVFVYSHRNLLRVLHESYMKYMKIPKDFRNKCFDIYRHGIKSCLIAVMNDKRIAAKTNYVSF